MRDIVITGRRIVREGWIFLGCLLFALAVNAFAIVKFKTQWSELFSTWPTTLTIAAATFIILGLARLIFFGMMLLLSKRC